MTIYIYMVKTKDIEESPGVVSLMRKVVKTIVYAGIGMIVSGIALTAYCIFTNSGSDFISVLNLIITSGAGMVTGSVVAKAWQSQAEQSTSPSQEQLNLPPEGLQ
jgi:multisubunit Na+/H+ antiporter MnhB subunit